MRKQVLGLVFLLCSIFFISPVLAAGPGESCTSHTDCTETECATSDIGCYCAGLIAGPTGTCETKHTAGQPCSEDVHCRTGLTCNITRTVCEAVSTPTTSPSSGSTEPTDSPPPPTRTPGEFGYVNPLGTVSLNVVLGRVIRTVLGFVGALFLAMFVYGGAQWMLAGGDAKKVESGRKALINAVIGIIIVALSYSVISVIFETASRIRG